MRPFERSQSCFPHPRQEARLLCVCLTQRADALGDLRGLAFGLSDLVQILQEGDCGVIVAGALRDNDDAAVKVRKPTDFRVGRAVASGKIEDVDGVVPEIAETSCEPTRQLRVDDELHAAGGWTRLICARRAAKARAASTSSRSRSS